jgi:hypothetical protein
MDWDLVIKAMSGINIVLTLSIAAVMWLRKPGEDSAKAVQAESEARRISMAELATRVSRIEETLKHMPTNEELMRLDGSLRESNARSEAMQSQLSAQSNQLTLIQRFLMDHNK